MMWGKSTPRKEGWYLCTVMKSTGHRYVLPLFRSEYPSGNFTWSGLCNYDRVIAAVKFPAPYQGVERI